MHHVLSLPNYSPLHCINCNRHWIKQICRYVVCQKCHNVYTISESKNVDNTSKKCWYRQFPNHPHAQMRLPCDTPLLRTIELVTRKKLLYPYLCYCYVSVESYLQSLLRLLQNANCGEQEEPHQTFYMMYMTERYGMSLQSIMVIVLLFHSPF